MCITQTSIILLIGIMIGAFILWKTYRGQKENFQKLSAKLSATHNVRTVNNNSLEGDYQGRRYECRYFPGSKNSPPSFTISVFCTPPFRLSVTREGGVERFSKNIGLTSEIQTGDPAFDSTYFINHDGNHDGETSAPQNYFYNAEVREAIKSIFTIGMSMKEVSFYDDRIIAVISPLSSDETAQVPVEMFLEKLAFLAAGLPPSTIQPARTMLAQVPARSIGAIVIVILLNMAAVGLLIAGLNLYKPLRMGFTMQSLNYSIPAVMLFLYVAFQMVKGRSSSHKIFIPLAIFSLIGFLLGGVSSTMFFNGYLDRGTVSEHEARITNRYCTKNKSSYNYYVVLDSWKTPGKAEKVSIGKAVYYSVETGKTLHIKTKPGYFGQEWLVEISPGKKMMEQPQ